MSKRQFDRHRDVMQETKLHPNSFVFMNVPDASRAQWHPFTLSYVRNSIHADQPAHATIYLKPYGRWVTVRTLLTQLHVHMPLEAAAASSVSGRMPLGLVF